MAKQKLHASGLAEYKATIGKTFDGKRIQKSFYGASKLIAKRKAEEYIKQQQIAEATGDIFIKKQYTFAEWATQWLKVYKKPNVSENTYRLTHENTVNKHLIPYFGSANIENIKNIDIQAFFATKKKLSDSMLAKMQHCLFAIFDAAIDNDLCYKNPAKKVVYASTAKKHEKQVYTSAEIEIAKKLSIGKMDEIVILLETGIRRGELLGLRWSDIDFANKTLCVNRSIADSKTAPDKISVNPPKHNSSRIIPLPPSSVDVLNRTPKNGEYIFPRANKLPQSPNTWAQKLSRFMANNLSDLPKLTAHELRHTYGTDLRRQGVDIYTIQKLMGHKDLKMTTELYVHNEVAELKKALNLE